MFSTLSMKGASGIPLGLVFFGLNVSNHAFLFFCFLTYLRNSMVKAAVSVFLWKVLKMLALVVHCCTVWDLGEEP